MRGLLDLVRPVRLDAPTSGRLAARAALSTVGVVVQGLVRFVYTFLIAHVLGADAVGRTNAAISLALLLSLLWPTAAGGAAAKFLALARGAGDMRRAAAVARHLGRWTLGTGVALAALAVGYAVLVQGRDAVSAGATAVLVLAYSGYGYVRGVQYGVGQVARATAWDVISAAAAIGLLVAVLLARVEPLLVLPLAVGYLVYAATGWPRGPAERLPRPVRREVDGFVGLTAVGTLASTGVMQASLLVAERVDAPAAVGYYAAALALATPASLISRSLSLALFPTMAEARGRGAADAVRAQTDLATRGLVALMTAAFGVVLIGAGPLVALLYPADFAPAADLLPPQVLSVLLLAVGVACVNRLNTAGQRGAQVVAAASVAGAVAAVTTWVVAGPSGGVTAVAWGLVAWAAVTGLLPMLVVWRFDGHRWAWLAVRGGTGLALLLGIWWAVRDASWPLVLAGCAAFLVVWVAIEARDVAVVARAALPGRRQAPGAPPGRPPGSAGPS